MPEPAPFKLTERFLGFVERSGNRLPDPVTLFALLGGGVVILSAIVSTLGIELENPSNGTSVTAVNLLTIEGLRRMLTEAIDNFAAFPPLALVLVTMIGVGVAERSGLISQGLRLLVLSVPPSLLTASLVFGGIMSSLAADAGYVVLTPLGALLFASVGRHPLAGLAAAFAGVSAGFSANLLLIPLDPLLSGLSTVSARLIDPDYVVRPTANYYFMFASVFFLAAVGTFINKRFVEPRLGKWQPPEGFQSDFGEQRNSTISPLEKKALFASAGVFFVLLVVIGLLLIPENGLFRTAEEGIQPFFQSLVMLMMLLFLAMGLTYGWMAGSIRSDKDAVSMMSASLATMGGYIVLAFFAAQFVAYFQWSNLGMMVAVGGADALGRIGMTGWPLIVGFVVMAAVINLFIGSASAKWAVMAPVFVPMLMLLGYSPELAQLVYRVGDSTTNIITPLMPYFPVIICFAKHYDPNAGMGTLFSAMLPYSIAFTILWAVMMIAWISFGLPIGPDAPIRYSPGVSP
ncbi:MAG: AbgT family transporter [Verrucomicrobiota bacterium]